MEEPRHLGLDVFERIWARTDAEAPNADDGFDISAMTDDQLMDWVVAIQHDAREPRATG